MLMLPAATESSVTHPEATEIVFTEDEQHQLSCVRLTLAAERHLARLGQLCPDHQACRRLAFARWLHVNRWLSEGAER
jgi:hypothetical protein